MKEELEGMDAKTLLMEGIEVIENGSSGEQCLPQIWIVTKEIHKSDSIRKNDCTPYDLIRE